MICEHSGCQDEAAYRCQMSGNLVDLCMKHFELARSFSSDNFLSFSLIKSFRPISQDEGK